MKPGIENSWVSVLSLDSRFMKAMTSERGRLVPAMHRFFLTFVGTSRPRRSHKPSGSRVLRACAILRFGRLEAAISLGT